MRKGKETGQKSLYQKSEVAYKDFVKERLFEEAT